MRGPSHYNPAGTGRKVSQQAMDSSRPWQSATSVMLDERNLIFCYAALMVSWIVDKRCQTLKCAPDSVLSSSDGARPDLNDVEMVHDVSWITHGTISPRTFLDDSFAEWKKKDVMRSQIDLEEMRMLYAERATDSKRRDPAGHSSRPGDRS